MMAAWSDEDEKQNKRAKISGEDELSAEDKRCGKHQFSDYALKKLKNRLDEEGDESKSCLYLQLIATGLSWLMVDFAATEMKRVSSAFDTAASNFPKELSALIDFGCDVWRSKIIIAGGMSRSGDSKNPSDRIYIYDTVKKIWDDVRLTLQEPRGNHPRVVVAGDRVLVFDGLPELPYRYRYDYETESISYDDGSSDEDTDSDRDHKFFIKNRYVKFSSKFDRARMRRFCEYFDFDSSGKPSQSKYLSKCKHQQPLWVSGKTHFIPFAVYRDKSLVLIWASSTHIVSLDYISFEWKTFLDLKISNSAFTPKLLMAPFRGSKAAVLEDFLFWVDYSTIYAFDLYGMRVLPVFTFPYLKTLCPQFDSVSPSFPLTSRHVSLHTVGRDMLCLLGDTVDFQICFATFKVLIGNGSADNGQNLRLVLDRAGYLRTDSATIQGAFSIPSLS